MSSQLLPQIRQIAERYLPLTVAIEQVEFFDDRVGYLRVQSLELESLQAQVAKLLPAEAQTRHYRRDYVAHITLAQIHQPKVLDKAQLMKAAEASLSLSRQVTIDSINYLQRILPRK